MATTKSYLKSKPECKVTFEVPPSMVKNAKKVFLAGSFNGWNAEENQVKKSKTGEYSIALTLATGCEYQYLFVVDGSWKNDPDAEKSCKNEFGGTNSVVVV